MTLDEGASPNLPPQSSSRNQTSTGRGERNRDDFVPEGENVCRNNLFNFHTVMDVFIESFLSKNYGPICVIFDLTPILRS